MSNSKITLTTSSNDDKPEPKNETRTLDRPQSRRRTRDERGLPNREALLDLARTYIETQCRLWPALASTGQIPMPDDANIAAYAEEFTQRFLNKQLHHPSSPAGVNSAASYLRYSSANSNPRSLDQQLQLQLERAFQNGHFVPWELVFADAAVTGTTAARIGYQLAKDAIETAEFRIEVLYIDEIGRASRDLVEALQLGRMIERLQKRLLGVSDGFDSDAPMAKMMLSIYGSVQEWFIDQLRSKVNRGMNDAFRRGTNTGPPAVGYKLVPAVDENGRPIYRTNGEVRKMLAIDEETAPLIESIFQLYGEKGWSIQRIARELNDRRVGGVQTWDNPRISQLLNRRRYIGIELYRTRSQYLDPETGNVVTKKHPRREWLVRRARHLQIVSWKLWKKVQKRRAEARQAYPSKGKKATGVSRTDLYPTTLVRPICGSCKRPMVLGRSGKYGSFTCMNGRYGRCGCSHRSYKTVRIVEECILAHLSNIVFTNENIERLVDRANGFLVEEALGPKVDMGPLRADLQKAQSERDQLVQVLKKVGKDDLDSVVAEIRQLERRIKDLNDRIRDAQASHDVPSPISKDDVQHCLTDLRALLSKDTTAAAPVLRELLGPVAVYEERPGEKGTIWIAEFTLNLVPTIARLAANRGCPTTDTWEHLSYRGWTSLISESVRLESTPDYQRLAPIFKQMHENGSSIKTIASANGVSWKYAKLIVEFATTGKWAGWEKHGRSKKRGTGAIPKYRQIADDVARLRDVEKLNFLQITALLNQRENFHVSVGTVTQAYDYTHRDAIQKAAADGKTPDRGRSCRLDVSIHDEIELRLERGESLANIASEVGCGLSTVRRKRKQRKPGQRGIAGAAQPG